MLFLYPNMMFEKTIDPEFHDEMIEADNRGYKTLTCWYARRDTVVTDVVYRGWMKNAAEYDSFYKSLRYNGMTLINNPQQYNNTHYLHNWYDILAEYTFNTYFFDTVEDSVNFADSINCSFLLKDDVKSGGIVNGGVELRSALEKMRKYRGTDGAGRICLRQYHALDSYSEKRFFCFMGNVFSCDGNVPTIVSEIAKKIDSNFFSIDIIEDIHGKEWLVEIGDGQVSGMKKWTVDKFYEIFGTCK